MTQHIMPNFGGPTSGIPANMMEGGAEFTQSASVDHHQPNRTDSNRIVIETPGIQDETVETPAQRRAPHDRIKIVPKGDYENLQTIRRATIKA